VSKKQPKQRYPELSKKAIAPERMREWNAHKRLLSESWSPTEKLVGFALVSHFWGKGEAWPGQLCLAMETGRDVKTVRGALRMLVDGDSERGLLPFFTRTNRPGRGAGFKYRLVENPRALRLVRDRFTDLVNAYHIAILGRKKQRGLPLVKLPADFVDSSQAIRRRAAVVESDEQREEIEREVAVLAKQLAIGHSPPKPGIVEPLPEPEAVVESKPEPEPEPPKNTPEWDKWAYDRTKDLIGLP